MIVYGSLKPIVRKKRKPKKAINRKKKIVSTKPYKPSTPYRRITQHVPSLEDNTDTTSKKESMKYTGDLVKGIATMHKSNAVPIINDEQAKDISKMRRN